MTPPKEEERVIMDEFNGGKTARKLVEEGFDVSPNTLEEEVISTYCEFFKNHIKGTPVQRESFKHFLLEVLTSTHNSTLDSVKEAVEKIDVDYYDNQIDTTTGSEMVEEFLAIINKLKQ